MSKSTPILGKKKQPFQNADVKKIFEAYPDNVREKLLFLREVIFETASNIKEVGELEETLKWGEPSYLTTLSKSGSTIRIDWKPSHKSLYAMYFNCNTNLIKTFKKLYPLDFRFQGKRSIVFHINDDVPVEKLRHCIAIALTYHLAKKKGHISHD
ncbi:MAG: DUF1801 domain-containing protein [Chlamydiales bacterium]